MEIQYYQQEKFTNRKAFAQIKRLPYRLVLPEKVVHRIGFSFFFFFSFRFCRAWAGCWFRRLRDKCDCALITFFSTAFLAYHVPFFDAHCHEFHFHFKVIYSVHPSLVPMASYIIYLPEWHKKRTVAAATTTK